MALTGLQTCVRAVLLLFFALAARAQTVGGILSTPNQGVNPTAEFYADGADYLLTPDGGTGTCHLGPPGAAIPFPGLTWQRLGADLIVYYDSQPLCVVWGYFAWRQARGTITWPDGSPGGTWTRV